MTPREPSPVQAALETIQRELARRSLKDFGEYVLPWWRPAPVHELVCEELEQVYTYIATGGEQGTGALIIEMPPQNGKTTMVSQLFPAWLLGKRPDSRVILTAYISDLAQDNSRLVRNLITGERFKALFGARAAVDEPVEISDDATAVARWSLAEPHRGGVTAAGVGGGITGKPAELIVIDDPFKNREEAESPTERKKKLKWLTSSVLSRMRKGTAIILIHTRWHREDLIGEMLKAMATNPQATQWKVLSLPAYPLEIEEYAVDDADQKRSMLEGLYKPLVDPLGRLPGSKAPLWEAEFPYEVLESKRATIEAAGELTEWNAQNLQQPRPAEGVFFSAADFQIVDRSPDGLQWVRYVDLAISEKKTADFNTTVAEALDAEGNLYLRDMVRVKGLTEFLARLKDLMLSDMEQGTIWGFEEVAFQALVTREMLRDPALAAVAIRGITPDGDKVTRARPLQTRAKAGRVKLVRGPWNQVFLVEALDFPNGTHDDQVDSASGGLGMLANSANGWVDYARRKLQEIEAQKEVAHAA